MPPPPMKFKLTLQGLARPYHLPRYVIKTSEMSSLRSIGSGLKVDPLDISSLLPGGLLHVDEEGSYYAADLWLWNISMTGLAMSELREVRTRYVSSVIGFYIFLLGGGVIKKRKKRPQDT